MNVNAIMIYEQFYTLTTSTAKKIKEKPFKIIMFVHCVPQAQCSFINTIYLYGNITFRAHATFNSWRNTK